MFVLSGNIAPANYFGDGTFHAVNTMQPPYQPSGNAPGGATDNDVLFANTAELDDAAAADADARSAICLTAKGVTWEWYAGAWDAAVADGRQAPDVARTVIYIGNANGIATPETSRPTTSRSTTTPRSIRRRTPPRARATSRTTTTSSPTPPRARCRRSRSTSPRAMLNQHAGYADLADGDAHIASVVAQLKASPQWKNMVIVVTYDENGGGWDHVAPPKGDLLGPGTRIPAIIISPFAKKGTVDHTQYDTGSILRLITRLFDLDRLPGLAARDSALRQARSRPMGDLTNALDLR